MQLTPFPEIDEVRPKSRPPVPHLRPRRGAEGAVPSDPPGCQGYGHLAAWNRPCAAAFRPQGPELTSHRFDDAGRESRRHLHDHPRSMLSTRRRSHSASMTGDGPRPSTSILTGRMALPSSLHRGFANDTPTYLGWPPFGPSRVSRVVSRFVDLIVIHRMSSPASPAARPAMPVPREIGNSLASLCNLCWTGMWSGHARSSMPLSNGSRRRGSGCGEAAVPVVPTALRVTMSSTLSVVERYPVRDGAASSPLGQRPGHPGRHGQRLGEPVGQPRPAPRAARDGHPVQRQERLPLEHRGAADLVPHPGQRQGLRRPPARHADPGLHERADGRRRRPRSSSRARSASTATTSTSTEHPRRRPVLRRAVPEARRGGVSRPTPRTRGTATSSAKSSTWSTWGWSRTPAGSRWRRSRRPSAASSRAARRRPPRSTSPPRRRATPGPRSTCRAGPPLPRRADRRPRTTRSSSRATRPRRWAPSSAARAC